MLSAGTLFLLSCSSGGGMSATAKKNKEVNSAIMKAYETGDFSKMSEYIAADAVDHGGEKGDVKGLENIVSEMKRYKSMVTDMKSTIIREMADDEYVMTWATMSAKMNGTEMSMSSVDVSRFKDGKAVEHWVFMNPMDMMKMMPQPVPGMDESANPPADSTKK